MCTCEYSPSKKKISYRVLRPDDRILCCKQPRAPEDDEEQLLQKQSFDTLVKEST